MTAFAWCAVTVLAVWLLWDEIRDTRADRSYREPPVTIASGRDPWPDWPLTLQPGDVIVGDDGTEYEVTEDWPADAIIRTLADVNRLPEAAA